ncbi:unnamed protein product [Allacma fusca]|uniref:Membrane-bound transcription factor site-2 protease n=1 Tax=Allacma fusca TaxID=39272 RepID=A0A8J2K466_9HEXA|nr:unnamed protein product [Allacma fusca]
MDWKTLVGFTVIFHGIVYAWRRQWILRLDTKKFNNCFNGLGTHRIRKYLRVWFRLGTYVTIVFGFPFTLWLFLRTIYNCLLPSVVSIAASVSPATLLTEDPLELHHDQLSPLPDADVIAPSNSGSTASSSYLAIQPILPGWNLPLSHLPYYILAILISVVIHEMGHAVASASHRIPIISVGFSFFGPLIPAAHVELNSAQLREAKFKKQLDILTAGVWMNLYLALITYFVMPRILPALMWPTHSSGTGLAVTGVLSTSGAGGPSGLERGDVIIGIENCPVENLDSWLTCLESIWKVHPVGYCLMSDSIAKFSNNSEDCCSPDGDNSPTHLCFLQMDFISETKEPIISGPNMSSNDNMKANQSSFCLPALPIITGNGSKTHNCHTPHYTCLGDNSESHCVLPRIVKDYKRFRTVQIHRRQYYAKESVLFVGDVFDLVNGVRTTEFVPRLSAGLAVVNMLPIYGLDGYHVVDAIVRTSVGKRWDGREVSRLVNVISWAALAVALLTVLCSVVQSF